MSRTYYNEIDRYAAQWLRNLITAGELPPGDVDERSIVDIEPADLACYAECHFFAGIGGWPYALRLAGWPDDRSVWTGSCPCQPLSSAGRRKGHVDERHLWPAFYRLIAECRPATIFGEQVAGALGREWLAGVRADLESTGYAIGAADLCAASVGAPHIRQRLFWVADTDLWGEGRERRSMGRPQGPRIRDCAGQGDRLGLAVRDCGDGGMADTDASRQPRSRWRVRGDRDASLGSDARDGGGLGDAGEPGLPAPEHEELRAAGRRGEGRAAAEPGCSFWAAADWLSCRDGRTRRIEPGVFPLAYGVPARMGKLRAAGNAIVPQVAAEFVKAFMTRLPREAAHG